MLSIWHVAWMHAWHDMQWHCVCGWGLSVEKNGVDGSTIMVGAKVDEGNNVCIKCVHVSF